MSVRLLHLHACRLPKSAGSDAVPDFSEGRMSSLEDQIRDAVRTKRSVYEGSKQMLLRLFK